MSGLDPKHMGSAAGLRFGRGFYMSPTRRIPEEYARRRILYRSAEPELYSVYTKNLNQLKPGRDYSFKVRDEYPMERRFLDIVIREPAYNLVAIRAAKLRGRVVLPKSKEAPF